MIRPDQSLMTVREEKKNENPKSNHKKISSCIPFTKFPPIPLNHEIFRAEFFFFFLKPARECIWKIIREKA